MKMITVEEHFMSKKVNDKIKEIMIKSGNVNESMFNYIDNFMNNSLISNLGEERIAYMDKVGIDSQVIGYGNNPPMNLKGEDAVELCRIANDELFQATQKYPGRFYGYAQIPVDVPDEAVKEMERCVKELGFVGVMIQGTFQGHFLDEERFYPIFEKAVELDIPIYFHPGELSENIINEYYKGKWSPMVTNTFSTYGIGWHYDVGVHVLRLILAGILDKLPNLKIVIGHWGEMIPYYFDRLDMGLNQHITGLQHKISYYFKNNVYTNPSGMFFKDDMDFCLKVMGKEHILWAQDYCYLSNEFVNTDNVKTYLEEYDIDDETKEMIAYRNAEQLFKI